MDIINVTSILNKSLIIPKNYGMILDNTFMRVSLLCI